jgi:PhoPQ-activated pathogenicity-related protein
MSLPMDQSRDLLDIYIRQHQGESSWTEKPADGHRLFELESQTWQGHKWVHELAVVEPACSCTEPGIVLEITGDNPDNRDLIWARDLADTTGFPVAVLFQVPNQPLLEMVEDDLVAHTLDQQLDGKGDDWPLLFPMTMAVLAAMDALEKISGGKWTKPVITGASKRGWTAWLAAEAVPDRISGLAPRVFDNLNMPAQMVKQQSDWGECSPMLEDYVTRGLDHAHETPPGLALIQQIDPWSRRSRVTVPTLVINAGNDGFWTVDALSVYWDDLEMPKALWTAPNASHGMDFEHWGPALGGFCRHCLAGADFPFVGGQMSPVSTRQWSAWSPDRVFIDSEWTTSEPILEPGWIARSTEMTWRVDGHGFSTSTPVEVDETG